MRSLVMLAALVGFRCGSALKKHAQRASMADWTARHETPSFAHSTAHGPAACPPSPSSTKHSRVRRRRPPVHASRLPCRCFSCASRRHGKRLHPIRRRATSPPEPTHSPTAPRARRSKRCAPSGLTSRSRCPSACLHSWSRAASRWPGRRACLRPLASRRTRRAAHRAQRGRALVRCRGCVARGRARRPHAGVERGPPARRGSTGTGGSAGGFGNRRLEEALSRPGTVLDALTQPCLCGSRTGRYAYPVRHLGLIHLLLFTSLRAVSGQTVAPVRREHRPWWRCSSSQPGLLATGVVTAAGQIRFVTPTFALGTTASSRERTTIATRDKAFSRLHSMRPSVRRLRWELTGTASAFGLSAAAPAFAWQGGGARAFRLVVRRRFAGVPGAMSCRTRCWAFYLRRPRGGGFARLDPLGRDELSLALAYTRPGRPHRAARRLLVMRMRSAIGRITLRPVRAVGRRRVSFAAAHGGAVAIWASGNAVLWVSIAPRLWLRAAEHSPTSRAACRRCAICPWR